MSLPPRDSEATTSTVFWGEDEGPVVMVWDDMTQEEQVISQTVISGGKDWVVWRTKPAQIKLGENTVGDQIHQEGTTFLEEFGRRLEGVHPQGSKSQRRSENGSGGAFTRRKDWYRLNDILLNVSDSLAFSLSSHRHSYKSLLFNSRFIVS